MTLDLTARDRKLVRASGIHPVVLDSRDAEQLGAPRAGASTTHRTGEDLLVALHLTYGEDDRPPTVLLSNYVPSVAVRVLNVTDDTVENVNAYLAGEARRAVALRSLEVPAGGAASLPRPLGELMIAREAELAPPRPSTLNVDGRDRAAFEVAHGAHTAYWGDVRANAPSVVIYAWGLVSAPRLVTIPAA